jgi:hypothetical protein
VKAWGVLFLCFLCSSVFQGVGVGVGVQFW